MSPCKQPDQPHCPECGSVALTDLWVCLACAHPDRPRCPACGCAECYPLGQLGQTTHYRCRACGMDYHHTEEPKPCVEPDLVCGDCGADLTEEGSVEYSEVFGASLARSEFDDQVLVVQRGDFFESRAWCAACNNAIDNYADVVV